MNMITRLIGLVPGSILGIIGIVIDDKTGLTVAVLIPVIGATAWIAGEIRGLREANKSLLNSQNRIEEEMKDSQKWRIHVQSELMREIQIAQEWRNEMEKHIDDFRNIIKMVTNK